MSPSLRFPSSPRARLLIVALVVGVLAAVLLVILRPSTPSDASASSAAHSPTAEDQGTPTTQPTPTPTATMPATPTAAPTSSTLEPDQAAKDAEAALRSYLVLADETYHRADGEVDTGLAGVAVGAALGEVEAATLELWNAGSRQVGTVEVSEVTVDEVDVVSEPPVVVLTACLDTGAVDILDVNGDSTRLGRPGIITRTAHIYRIELHDKVWRVASHDFPAKADC